MFDVKTFPNLTVRLDRTHPLSIGLQGWWPMAGDGRDILERYPTTLTSAKPVLSHGGTATNFAGSSYGSFNAIPSIGTTFSLSIWAYPTNLNQASTGGGFGGTILESNTDGTSSGWDLGCEYSTNKIWFWPAGNADVRSSGSIILNKWNHIGLTVTGTTVKIYLAGQLDSTNAAAAAAQIPTYLRIGHQSHCTGYWVGNLRDLRLYNRVLSAAEITRLYLEPFCNLQPVSRRLVPTLARVMPD